MIVLKEIKKKISDSFELNVKNITLVNNNNYKIYGKNGSGKTIFLKMLLGIISKDSGVIENGKNSISGFLGIERMVDFLTPKEYFYIVCKSNGISKKEVLVRYNYVNSFFNRKYMDEKKLICDYSDGNKQLIGIIAACLPFSDFIILDEPFNYLDSETTTVLVKMVNQLNKEKGISFVYSDNSNRIELEKCQIITINDGIVK